MLDADIGADGLKTGYTEASGYAIVGSAVQDGRRLFLGMSGMESSRERAREAVGLLRWGFRAFEPRELVPEGTALGEIKVYGGEVGTVPVSARGPVVLFLPIAGRADLKAEIAYTGPLQAPVRKGDEVAVLRVSKDGQVSQETPLVATEDVGIGPLHRRAMDAALEALQFWN